MTILSPSQLEEIRGRMASWHPSDNGGIAAADRRLLLAHLDSIDSVERLQSSAGWVAVSERLPGVSDCNPGTHAVLGWHENLKAPLIDHWSNIATNKFYTHWQPLPSAPPIAAKVSE